MSSAKLILHTLWRLWIAGSLAVSRREGAIIWPGQQIVATEKSGYRLMVEQRYYVAVDAVVGC